jgi:hypothetical protein
MKLIMRNFIRKVNNFLLIGVGCLIILVHLYWFYSGFYFIYTLFLLGFYLDVVVWCMIMYINVYLVVYV